MSVVSKRIFGLDLLRSVAIILVLLTHTISFLDPQNLYYKIPVYTGYFGVEFFFILSGFLIGTILLKIHYQTEPLNFENIKIFWVRRWFRTLPNYYLMFFVYALLAFFVHHLNVFSHIKYLAYLVFLQNSVSYQPNDFFQVAWSLSIEEWFYLIFPFLLLLLTRVFYKNRSLPFLLTIIIFIVAELGIRTYMAIFYHHTWDNGFRKLMPLRLDSIAIGVLAAYVKFNKPLFWGNNIKKLAVTGLILITGLTVYFTVDYVMHFSPVSLDQGIKTSLFLETGFFTLLSFSIALMLPYLCYIKVKDGLLSRGVTFISEMSYTLVTYWLSLHSRTFLHIMQKWRMPMFCYL